MQLIVFFLEPADLRSFSSVCRRTYQSTRHQVRSIFFSRLRTDLSPESLKKLGVLLSNDPDLASYVTTLAVKFDGDLGAGLCSDPSVSIRLQRSIIVHRWTELLPRLVNCTSFIFTPAIDDKCYIGIFYDRTYPTFVEANMFLEILSKVCISVRNLSVRLGDCKCRREADILDPNVIEGRDNWSHSFFLTWLYQVRRDVSRRMIGIKVTGAGRIVWGSLSDSRLTSISRRKSRWRIVSPL